MSQSTAEIPPILSPGNDAQRLAWGVLLLAFALFCVLCVAIGIGVNYFLFRSPLPMDSVLVVSRGSAGIFEPSNERFVPSQTELSNNTKVSTTSPSQATLFFLDTQVSNRLIANVTLKNNSSITLQSALRPRFDWSTSQYVIWLYEAVGEFDITISDNIDRDVLIYVQTGLTKHTQVTLDGPGNYLMSVTEKYTEVYNRDGNVYLIPTLESMQGYSIPSGKRGTINTETSTVDLGPGYVNLLRNSTFDTLNENVGSGSVQELLSGWVCNNDPSDQPPGEYLSQIFEGRMTLRLERYGGATTHGRTSCSQTFGSNALDVNASGLDYLSLRANFYIRHQSLDTCGVDGSECPLALRIDYLNQDGNPEKWFHGFYAQRESSTFPLICTGGCVQEHEYVNEQSWYTYDSGNLLNLFPNSEANLNSIVGIMFYASGHEYDVQVSEVALLGRQKPDVPLAEITPSATETISP